MKFIIERGVTASEQESSWQNGTLQPCGGGTYVSTIQTHVLVPHTVDAQGEDAVVDYIQRAIERGDVDFTIIVGAEDRDA